MHIALSTQGIATRILMPTVSWPNITINGVKLTAEKVYFVTRFVHGSGQSPGLLLPTCPAYLKRAAFHGRQRHVPDLLGATHVHQLQPHVVYRVR